ncbi:MAG: glutamine amidotransferase [Actinomycetota bacterium]|nr:glutamine amidotransferase [Actinomycetota bacterium]
MKEKIKVVSVLPNLLGTYGDSGNAVIVSKRLALRGFKVDLVHADLRSGVPSDADFYLIGGGEDGPQSRAAEFLAIDTPLERALDKGAGLLAVCAGFQILGRSFIGPDMAPRNGLGIFGCRTHRFEGPRSVGELVVDPGDAMPGVPMMTGYENHQGITELLDGTRPLGIVRAGNGNNFGPQVDGGVIGRAIGTYMHGPVFARNPKFCDYFLSLVLGHLDPIRDEGLENSHNRLYFERINQVLME